MSQPTVADAAERAIEALVTLAAKGEAIEEESQYVTDLVTVYRGRIGQVATTRGAETLTPDAASAIDTAIEEAGLMSDPHRAIDWLSTLPQVVLFTLGETA